MTTRRANQGGSLLSFIIIGVALAAAVVGTVYFVRQRGHQAQVQTSTPTVSAPQDNPASAPTPAPSSNSGTTSLPGDAHSSTPPAVAPSSGNGSTPSTSNLPHTGPTETLMSAVAVGILCFVGVTYQQSRRTLRRLASSLA